MRRDAAAETKPTKTKDSSSESSSESMDEIIADLGKTLNAKENEELKKLMNDIHTAKDDADGINAYVRNIYIFTSNSMN